MKMALKTELGSENEDSTLEYDDNGGTEILPCLACASTSRPTKVEKMDDKEEERLELQAAFVGFCTLLKVNVKRRVEKSEPVPPLCGDCTYQLYQLLLVRKMLRDFKKALAKGVKELKEKCVAAEEEFRTRGIYKKNRRYKLIRRQIVSETFSETSLNALIPTPTPAYPRRSASDGLKPSCNNNENDAKGSPILQVKRVMFASDDQYTSKSTMGTDATSASLKDVREKLAGDLINEANKAKMERKLRSKRSKSIMRMTITQPRKLTCGSSNKVEDEVGAFNDSDDLTGFKTAKPTKKRKNSVNKYNSSLAKLRRKEARGKVECPICGKPYANMQYLKTHKFTHYNQQDLAEAMMSGEMIVEKRKPSKVKCEECGKILSSRTWLKSHKKALHSNPTRESKNKVKVGKFVCTICNRRYSWGHNLKCHQRAHHSNVPYFKCPQCSQVLYSRQTLQKHLMRHQNKRPFQCSICSRTYVTSDHLKRHQRNVHNKV